MVLVGKDVYYKNMVLFVQRLQSLVTFKGAALVKANMAMSLRGSALEWYTSELSNFDRNALNNNPGVKSWINTLFHRFKVPTNVALGLLTDETYSLEDARACRPAAQYVKAIMRHGIGCNIVDVANQQPWRPSEWLVNNTPDGPRRQPPPSFRQSFVPQRQQYSTNDQRLHQAPSASSPTGASRDTAPRRTQPNQSTWFNPIDAATRPRAAAYLDASRQRYRSDQPDRGYQQKEEKGVYQIESNATEQQPEGFHTTFEPEEEELSYSDEGFDEVFVNFVGIEAVCSKYRSSFPSKSKLHMHIKSGYMGKTLSSACPQSSSSIPVIVSKAVFTSLGSDFSFKG